MPYPTALWDLNPEELSHVSGPRNFKTGRRMVSDFLTVIVNIGQFNALDLQMYGTKSFAEPFPGRPGTRAYTRATGR